MESGLLRVKELIVQLEATKTATGEIFDRVLPPLDQVEELARSINASILPESQVAGIVANATASHQVAQQALELAQNARSVFFIDQMLLLKPLIISSFVLFSETVRVTQSLIDQLNSDLNSTEMTQDRVQEAIYQLSNTINNFRQQLEQVRVSTINLNLPSCWIQIYKPGTQSYVCSHLAFYG